MKARNRKGLMYGIAVTLYAKFFDSKKTKHDLLRRYKLPLLLSSIAAQLGLQAINIKPKAFKPYRHHGVFFRNSS